MLDWTTLNALLKASVKLYETSQRMVAMEEVSNEVWKENSEAFEAWEKALTAAGLIQPPEEKSIEEVLG